MPLHVGIFENELSVGQGFAKLASLLLTGGKLCYEVSAVALHIFFKVYNPL